MGVISHFWKTIATGYKLFLASIQILKITYAANATTIEGRSTTGGNLIVKANTVDARAYMVLEGNGNIAFHPFNTFKFYDGADYYLSMTRDSGAKITAMIAGDDVYLATLGTGVIKFGTYTAGAASDSTGYITIKDAAGNTRKLMVQA